MLTHPCQRCGQVDRYASDGRCRPCHRQQEREREQRRPKHPLTIQPLAMRFWAKVMRTDGCWLWTGGHDPRGYGRINIGPNASGHRSNRTGSAHRVSWELTFGGHPCVRGPLPTHIYVCHHCDVPACVRPEHLFVGTQRDNLRDMRAKGRGRH